MASPSSTAPSTSSSRLAPALLQLSDLPDGFRTEPLTERNLPSLIKGCPGLEVLATSRSVLVGFDRATQRSAPLTEDHRGRLLDELGAR